MTAHTQDRAAWFVGAFERFENDLNGEAQTPLHRTRRQAIENFARGGIPTPRDEDWNYTNVAPYLRHDFEPANAEAAAALNAEALAPFLFEGEGARLVVVQGQDVGQEEHQGQDQDRRPVHGAQRRSAGLDGEVNSLARCRETGTLCT